MQRYSAASCGGGVNNGAISGASSRENARAESPLSTSNFTLNTRRQPQLSSYQLKCDKEPLNCRLGPPDFYPQTQNCPEETLTREYLQFGYKETVEGIEEAREIALVQIPNFLKPELTVKCKEAIRKRFRAINESRSQRRKAGQVYGVPLSGSLLIKPGVFPEQRSCSEDFRRKWIEALSQHHKRLRSLAEHVPHGYRRKSLFEVLIRHNVPFLRATWFIKVTYLNQARPASTNVSSGAPDKTQLWTKDVIGYLQQLLNEFFSKDGGSFAPLPGRDQSSQALTAGPGPAQHQSDSVPATPDDEEPSLHFKWWYMVQLLRWHYSEGLLLPSLIIEWVLNQLQEKDSAEALELLLPVVFDLIESIVMSQTYVRMLVDIAVRSINGLSSSDSSSVDNLKKQSLTSALVRILQYLILSVPDTFVALDCFPLPSCVVPDLNCGNTVPKVPEGVDSVHFDMQDTFLQYLSCRYAVSSIQKRASNLAKIVNPSFQGHGAAKVVQALDKALIIGDLKFAYNSLFEDLSDMAAEEQWVAEVSPCLRASLKWIGTVGLPLICSVFFLCEWATCDYRDCRTVLPQSHKFTGRKDFSQVYIALLLLKHKLEDMRISSQSKSGCTLLSSSSGRATSVHDTSFGGTLVENVSAVNNMMFSGSRKHKIDIFQSPGPLHDIIVCWLDQHEVGNAGGFKCVEVFIMELIRNGIFYPQAYVRQLIVSGIMDRNVTAVDLERQRRHQKILKQLPGSCLVDVQEEAKIVEAPLLYEIVCVYSNERQLMLCGLLSGEFNDVGTKGDSYQSFALQKNKDHSAAVREGKPVSYQSFALQKNKDHSAAVKEGKHVKAKDEAAELKILISTLLHFPYSMQVETHLEESQRSFKRPLGSFDIKVDWTEATPGCEECKHAKRQKLGDERSSPCPGFSSNQSDDEDTWWVRKGLKSQESFKVEMPLKSTKLPSRGRQKTVRKTQSLAQLAAARIESSQGASTSHVCDNKESCPPHKSVSEGEVSKDVDQMKTTHLSNIRKAIKRLRWLERRSISIWLLKTIRQLVEENEKATSNASNCTGIFSVLTDDRNAVRWRIGEDELLSILCILDVASDLLSVVKFLLWLLPKTLGGPSIAVHAGRSIMLPQNRENQVCQVGEAFLLSSLQRYENILLASDLLPEVLTTLMQRTVALVTSHGRSFRAASFAYARNLLKKYRDVASVTKWEKTFRATCDQRLLAEFDAGRSLDGDLVFSSGVPAGVEDMDEYLHQKMTGRLPRTSPNLKEMVQRHVDEVVHSFYGKERKPFPISNPKGPMLENREDSNPIAQDIVLGLLDCIRQNGGATLEGDPSIVASAVSAIVGNVGPAISKLPDFTSGRQSFSSTTNSLNCVRHILCIHITSLRLLKEALGERLSCIFDISLAAEASSAISGAFAPGKTNRSQFQTSPETHDIYASHSNEIMKNSAKLFVGRSAKAAAAVSALVVGAIVHGATSLERMVTAFKLKEGLDVLQFIRSARTSSNGMSRSIGNLKLDHCIEVYVHWFRLLVGNCRTVSDGLVAEILGESYILALSRMQRMLPLNLVLPPAYSIFAMVIWRPYILNINIATREDIQLYHYLSVAIGDAIRHQPFRELCFRNTHVFYDLVATDVGDSEFAAMLELHNPDKHLKTMTFVPLRARLFLNALIDCKMPAFTIMEDGSWISGPNEQRAFTENEAKLQDQLVHVLDNLQAAKFHWQWVELRLLLNEQALNEKIETQNLSLVEAIRSLSPNSGNNVLSENEKKFTEIILTRTLVRPDAAPLYSELVHLLGKLQQESLVVDIKWILGGPDVLLGWKSIRQQLIHLAQRNGLSTKPQFWKPWGWSSSITDDVANRGDKRKLDAISIEEGELVDECIDVKRSGKMNFHSIDAEGFSSKQLYITEKALAELTLPCIDRSSSDIRNLFAAELIKQMGSIDQQINAITRGGNKQVSAVSSGTEASSSKGNTRKGMRGGSPVLGRRATGVSDSTPLYSTSLKASLWLRLQFLLRLLPIIYSDREPSARNMRQMLASIILRLLGTRIVYEDADLYLSTMHIGSLQRDAESPVEASVAASLEYSSDSLFERLLCVLHGLLSNCKPSWLKPKPTSKSSVKSPRDFSAFDREAAESLQADLDRMVLPATIRRRIQAAMPILPPLLHFSSPLSSAALASLHPNSSTPGTHQRTLPTTRTSTNQSGRNKRVPSQDLDMEIDPWTLLEDGTGSASTSGGNSNMVGVGVGHSNLKACSWLKGAVRVRRTDLTYIGALDEDS